MTRFSFFTTEGCHLCEQAWQQVIALGLQDEMSIIEIINDENHVAQYGIRIPVIKNNESERDIGWPFNVDLLANFVKEN